jgi:branched-chain amino acid transport system permease protein
VDAQSLVDAVALGSLYALVAVGVALVFGVLRIVNFAHGELITAGAYALVFTDEHGSLVAIVVCFAVVIALALAMDVALRPLRGYGPATVLVATFGISFLLQSIALLAFGAQGNNVSVLPRLNRAAHIAGTDVRWVSIVSIAVTLALLGGTGLLLNRTTIGLQMRAAAADFRAARILGVRTNLVISLAFVIGAVMAACVSVLLAVQTPFVYPTFGANILIPALIGVVVGGLDRLPTATLGAFAIGFATSQLGDVLNSAHRVYLDSYVFLLVIVVLLVRPEGLFAPFRRRTVERV